LAGGETWYLAMINNFVNVALSVGSEAYLVAKKDKISRYNNEIYRAPPYFYVPLEPK